MLVEEIMERKNILTVKDLNVCYKKGAGKQQILNHISFEMKQGKILVLVGETAAENPHGQNQFWAW